MDARDRTGRLDVDAEVIQGRPLYRPGGARVDKEDGALSAFPFALALLLPLLVGCDGWGGIISLGDNRPAPPDAGTPDTGRPDAGERDAGPGDGGPPDAGLGDGGPALPDLVPVLLSDPPEALAPGDPLDLELTVANIGARPSTETTLRVTLEAAGALTLLEPLLDPIPSGDRTSLRLQGVVPTGTVGPHRLALTVDPQDVIQELDETNNRRVGGRIYVGEVVVRPQRLDLSVPAGCTRQEQLTIENRGPAATPLSARVEGAAGFSIALTETALAPEETVTATVTFAPASTAVAQGSLLVQHVRPGSPIPIALFGDGDDGPRTERFEQFEVRKVDLLFVVDDSCSMDEEQALLGARFSAFLDLAQEETIDYHVAVTTTDLGPGGAGGAFVGSPPVITPRTPDPAAAFAANAMVGLSGADLEQGLAAARAALSPPLIGGPNAGFLRPDASLGVIFVSDEDDQSAGPVDDYAAFLLALRPAPFLRANAIVGEAPSGCATAGPGLRYLDLVDRIGGVSASICTANWDQTLLALAAGGFGFKTRFQLSGIPRPNTIEVHVNGQPLPRLDPQTGAALWRYLPAENGINFEPVAVPEAGAAVEVTYEPGCP